MYIYTYKSVCAHSYIYEGTKEKGKNNQANVIKCQQFMI